MLHQIIDRSLPGNVPKLEFRYFETQLFHVTAFVLLVTLPMQSEPIITDVVSSNLNQGEVYNIM
jgi:hypothetical protein